MPVQIPGKRLLGSIPLKFVQAKHGHGGKGVYASLNLTSMIDFLVIIVVFLLMSFAASGELLTIQRGLELPDASQTTDLERAPIVAIGKDVVTLDGKRMTDVPSLLRDAGTAGDWRIENLVVELDTLRRNWAIVHPREPFPGAVVLQADKATDFRVIKKVMFSAAQAGYPNIAFAVNRSTAAPTGK